MLDRRIKSLTDYLQSILTHDLYYQNAELHKLINDFLAPRDWIKPKNAAFKVRQLAGMTSIDHNEAALVTVGYMYTYMYGCDRSSLAASLERAHPSFWKILL